MPEIAEILAKIPLPNILTCHRCETVWERPPHLAAATFRRCQFVCKNCRCKDCSVVLNIECECGECHTKRSTEDPQVCIECILIRQRVSSLGIDLQQLRNADIDDELRENPIYALLPASHTPNNEIQIGEI